jgi:hypothetical protein
MLSGIWLLFVVHRIPQSVIMPLNLWWNNIFNPVFNISSIISRLLVVMDIVKPVVRETKIEDTNAMAKRKKTKVLFKLFILIIWLELSLFDLWLFRSF